jgi:hypothetical protein
VPGGADPATYAAELAAGNSVEASASPGIGGAGGFSPSASGAAGLDGTAQAVRVF